MTQDELKKANDIPDCVTTTGRNLGHAETSPFWEGLRPGTPEYAKQEAEKAKASK